MFLCGSDSYLRNQYITHLYPKVSNMPSIVCISDTHGQHKQVSVPGGDILIHAGDICAWGDDPKEYTDFNAWLGTLPHKHKILIFGNHDVLGERNNGLARSLITNATYLEDSGIKIEGLNFWGSPFTPEFCNWAFNVPRGELHKHWDLIPRNTDVLITHGPAYGILDTVSPKGPYLGDKELLAAVKRIKPQLHVSGHIHGGYGIDIQHSPTLFVNASVVNEAYKVVNRPLVVNL